MSQQPPSPADHSNAIANLNEEISFQRVLLISLDDSAEDQSSRKVEIEAEIVSLQKQLENLSGIQAAVSTHTRAPSISHNSSNGRPSAISHSRMDNTHGRASNGGYQFKKEGGSMESLSSTASTPGSGVSMAESSSSTRVDLPTRKRSHSKHLDAFVPFEETKSRRTTPSPFATGVTTPSGSSGYGYNANGDGYFDLTMDDDIIFDPSYTILQRQEEQRLQRERKDAEYASTLANSNNFVSSNPITSSKPSAFSKMLGVHLQASTSRENQITKPSAISNVYGSHAGSSSARSLPWKMAPNPVFKAEPQTSTSSQPLEFSSTGLGGARGKHQEGAATATDSSFTSKQTATIPGAYIEESASDSELEIIDPSAFKDNGRQRALAVKTANAYSHQGSIYSSSTRALGERALSHPKTSRQNYLHENNRGISGSVVSSANGMNNSLPQWVRRGTGTAPNDMDTTQLAFSMDMKPSTATFNSSGTSGVQGFGRPNTTMALHDQPHPLPGNGLPGSFSGSMHSAHLRASIHGASSGLTVDSLPKYGMGETNLNSLQHGTADNMGKFSDFGSDFSFFDRSLYTAEMTDQMDHVINDPRKTEREIKDLLENIKAEIEIPLESREGTPEGLRYPLYEHQKIALTWLKQMEEGTNKGGILADDMGLGKTISTLSLILSRPSADRACKTTLIAAPVALLRQWGSEIDTKTLPAHKPSVYMAHGNSKKATWDDLRQYDVVLTTYGTLGAEYTRLLKFEEECKQKGIVDPDAKQMAKDFPFLGPRSRFYRVVLDEAQCIKNKSTKAASSACRLRALTRFCLTGTPMMNNITELYSLIKFLRIRPYNSWASFVKDFGCLSKGSYSDKHIQITMQRLQGVLKAILLRRTKKSEIDGKPIIVLPPKVEEIDHVVFSKDEWDFYESLRDKTKLQFNKYRKAGTVGKNYSNILVLLLRLRQCCCHPHLIIDLEAAAGSAELTEDQMIERALALEPDVVARLLAADGFECNICYDATPNPSIIIPCGHDNCHDCLMLISEQAKQEAQGNDEGRATVKCPSCRGKLDMANLIDYRTFRKAHMPPVKLEGEENVDSVSDLSDVSTDSDSDTDFDSGVDTKLDDVDENGNLDGFIVPDDIEDDEAEQEDDEAEQGDDEIDEIDDLDDLDDLELGVLESKPKSESKTKPKNKEKKNKGKGKKVEKQKQHLSIAMMKKEASRSIAGHKKYMRYLRKNWQSSAKVDKCVELLETFQTEGEKTIIFSQFVTFLDLLQVPIGEKGWKCERYDGSINAKRRDDAIKQFTNKPDCNIMLISLKAGNAGLNLVAASRVIILDPFWNPFIEMQAVDRAHRIGQMKSVQVHRILIKDTVEDRIMALQKHKKELVESALDEGAMKTVGRLDERQLAFLFGV